MVARAVTAMRDGDGGIISLYQQLAYPQAASEAASFWARDGAKAVAMVDGGDGVGGDGGGGDGGGGEGGGKASGGKTPRQGQRALWKLREASEMSDWLDRIE